jgi:hypothetical protein
VLPLHTFNDFVSGHYAPLLDPRCPALSHVDTEPAPLLPTCSVHNPTHQHEIVKPLRTRRGDLQVEGKGEWAW